MIPFNNRFHGHSSLNYVYKNGQSSRSRFFVLKIIENKKRKNTRIAVVVSKKVLKSAVRRNRIRRRVYESLRYRMANFEKKFDIVLTVSNSEVYSMPYKNIEDQLNQLFTQLKI